MMLRSGRVLRAVMALLAFGVALQGAMPLATRVCAMHAADHAARAQTEQAPAEHAPAEHAPAEHAPAEHAPAEHAHHTPASLPSDDAAPTNAPGDAPRHGCDCLTDCCGVPTLALSLSAATPAAPMRATSTTAPRNPAPPRTAPADRLLPFANGPPPHALG